MTENCTVAARRMPRFFQVSCSEIWLTEPLISAFSLFLKRLTQVVRQPLAPARFHQESFEI